MAILGIVDQSGKLVVKYKYDAYGNSNGIEDTSGCNLGTRNLFRYKGYYYDDDTKMYYCKLRFYVPLWHRWLNSDSINYLEPKNITSLNLFTYCNNNPVMYVDPSGNFGIWALLAITITSMLIGGGGQFISNALAGKKDSELWRGVAGASIGTGVDALALCLAMPSGGASLFIAAGISSIVQTGVDLIENKIRGEEFDCGQMFIDLGINFIITLAGNCLGSKIIPTNFGWFQPKKILSVFTKPYGQKILLQTVIGVGVSGTINFIRKNNWNRMFPIIPMPIIKLC